MDTPHLAGEDTLSIKIFDPALCRLKRTRRNIPQELIKDFALHGLGPMSYHHGLTRTPASSWTSILTPHTSAQAVGGHSRDTLTQCALSLFFAGFKLIIAEVRQGPEPVAVDTAASSGQ